MNKVEQEHSSVLFEESSVDIKESHLHNEKKKPILDPVSLVEEENGQSEDYSRTLFDLIGIRKEDDETTTRMVCTFLDDCEKRGSFSHSSFDTPSQQVSVMQSDLPLSSCDLSILCSQIDKNSKEKSSLEANEKSSLEANEKSDCVDGSECKSIHTNHEDTGNQLVHSCEPDSDPSIRDISVSEDNSMSPKPDSLLVGVSVNIPTSLLSVDDNRSDTEDGSTPMSPSFDCTMECRDTYPSVCEVSSNDSSEVIVSDDDERTVSERESTQCCQNEKESIEDSQSSEEDSMIANYILSCSQNTPLHSQPVAAKRRDTVASKRLPPDNQEEPSAKRCMMLGRSLLSSSDSDECMDSYIIIDEPTVKHTDVLEEHSNRPDIDDSPDMKSDSDEVPIQSVNQALNLPPSRPLSQPVNQPLSQPNNPPLKHSRKVLSFFLSDS